MRTKLAIWALWSFVASVAVAEAQITTLSVGDGISISSTAVSKIVVRVNEKATYRIENLTHDTTPVEFSVSSKFGALDWVRRASNRNLKGTLDAWVELDLDPKQQNQLVVVGPPALEKPLRFRLQKVVFSSLRDTLKQDLTYTLPSSLPLRERQVWSTDRAYDRFRAVQSKSSSVYVAALSRDGSELQVFSLAERTRIGPPVNGRNFPVTDFDLSVTPEGDPLVCFTTDRAKLAVRQWNRTGWIDQTPDAQTRAPARWIDTPTGPALAFVASSDSASSRLHVAVWSSTGWKSIDGKVWDVRSESGPTGSVRVGGVWWNSSLAIAAVSPSTTSGVANRVLWTTAGGVWTDAQVPQIVDAVEVYAAEVSGTLYTTWQKTDGSFLTYQTREDGLWQILPTPKWAFPDAERTVRTIGSGGSLWIVESNGTLLQLHQFDTIEWRASLKLAALTPAGLKAFELFGPKGPGRSASLLIASADSQSTRLAVYDLP